ncbi:MAG: GNAT family N-acetyltransferase [Bryobacteraceae bacterium]
MSTETTYVIVPASVLDMPVVRDLFLEYSRTLGVDLCFQNFSGELEGLPGDYAPPAGRVLLARFGTRAAGCVAVRPLADGACEMKRLYVQPDFRNHKVGLALILTAITEARHIGYQRMRLDTLPGMERAIALYRSLGFREIEPYYPNPVPGALFLELDLR